MPRGDFGKVFKDSRFHSKTMGPEQPSKERPFERIDQRLEKIEKRLDEFESEIANLRNRLDKAQSRLSAEGQFRKFLRN